jgi:hypothetical protein
MERGYGGSRFFRYIPQGLASQQFSVNHVAVDVAADATRLSHSFTFKLECLLKKTLTEEPSYSRLFLHLFVALKLRHHVGGIALPCSRAPSFST